MNHFIGNLDTRSWTAERLLAGGYTSQRWDLLADLTFMHDTYGAIVAPVGMTTDLASIPRFAWAYIAPDDPAIEFPSIIHDRLYLLGGDLGDGRVLTRQQADDVLIDGMTVCGARWDQMKIVRFAVRTFGGSHWKTP